MKYFIEMTRPKRYLTGTFTDFVFKKNVIFEVEHDSVYDLYVEAAENDYITHEQIDWAFETGEYVYVDTTNNAVALMGVEMSDKMLFKRRLKGTIGKEVFNLK
jgi:hypothetical protein